MPFTYNNHVLYLDIKQQDRVPLQLVKGDISNSMEVFLTDNGSTIDLTGLHVRAVFKRSDGHVVYQGEAEEEGDAQREGVITVTPASGKLQFALRNGSYSDGDNEMEIQILTDDYRTKITSAYAIIRARNQIMTDIATQSSYEFPILAQLVSALENMDITVTTLDPTEDATGTITLSNGVYHLALGIPRGATITAIRVENGELVMTLSNGQELSVSLALDIATAVNEWLDAHPEATTTVQDGSLTMSKFTTDLRWQTENYYDRPELHGGVCDGTTDDTTAFVAACAPVNLKRKTVYAKNCKIGTCSIHNCKIIAEGLIVTGTVTLADVELSGTVTVDGGGFVIARGRNGDESDDRSNLHDMTVTIQSCTKFLTITGNTYNVKFVNNNIQGKCTDSVISIEPVLVYDAVADPSKPWKSSEWVTYTLIKDNYLSTSITPIKITGRVSGIYIINTYAQRYPDSAHDSTPRRFISTKARGGNIFVDGSFMYDLDKAVGDTELYLYRGDSSAVDLTDKWNYNVKHNIGVQNVEIARGLSSFALDSDGNYGRALSAEINDYPSSESGEAVPARPLAKATDAAFYTNPSGVVQYGTTRDVAYNAGSPNGWVAGQMLKFGSGSASGSKEVLLGANEVGEVTTYMRNANSQEWTEVKNAKIHYSSGSAISSLSTIVEWGMGLYRLAATISPTGALAYFYIIRCKSFLLCMDHQTGKLYVNYMQNDAWQGWQGVTMTAVT